MNIDKMKKKTHNEIRNKLAESKLITNVFYIR